MFLIRGISFQPDLKTDKHLTDKHLNEIPVNRFCLFMITNNVLDFSEKICSAPLKITAER